MNVDRILPLRRANRYSFPQNPDAILPRAFGNHLDLAISPADNPDAGFVKAECVDRLNLIYVINDGPVVAVNPQIKWNGVVQTDPTVFAFNPTNNLEGRGVVATLQFKLYAVLGGELSVRHGGSVDGQGFPITNPMRGLIWMLMEYGGWTTADFDRGTVEQTIRDLDLAGYPLTMVFQEQKSVREWLLELLPMYHIDATETGNGQLALIFDRTMTPWAITPVYHVPAYEIVDHGSPVTAISAEKQIDDLANQITLRGRHDWTSGQPTTSYVADYEQSQAAYGTAYPVEFSFWGMSTIAHATLWLNAYITRHGFEPRIVRFTMRGLKGTVLIPPSVITVEWPLRGWQQRLLKVRRRTTSWSRHEVDLECIDCWRELSDGVEEPTASLTQRREQISRVFQWIPGTIGDQGLIEDAPGPSKNEAANGDFELGDNGQWDLKGGSATARWSIVEDPPNAKIGRFYALSLPNMTDYNIITLRRRIDPGEWVLITGWFQNLPGANSNGLVYTSFYDTDGVAMTPLILGNFVPPTGNYLESVLLAQAPAGAYHFRPGIGLFPLPTVGQWRADKVVASTGSRAELLLKRMNDLGSGNLILNGDFEMGDVNWQHDSSWYLDTAGPHSGSYGFTHQATSNPSVGNRLFNLTRVPLNPGQIIRMQAYVVTTGGTTGQIRLGASWLNGQGAVVSEIATTFQNAPIGSYTYFGDQTPVPAGVVYGSFFVEVINHTTGFIGVDDVTVWNPN